MWVEGKSWWRRRRVGRRRAGRGWARGVGGEGAGVGGEGAGLELRRWRARAAQGSFASGSGWRNVSSWWVAVSWPAVGAFSAMVRSYLCALPPGPFPTWSFWSVLFRFVVQLGDPRFCSGLWWFVGGCSGLCCFWLVVGWCRV